RAPGRRARPRLRGRGRARTGRQGKGSGHGRRRARRPRNADVRGGRVIARAAGRPISITGLGCHVPARVMTNDDLARIVETSDEWIRDRTGIRERRIASDSEAMSDLSLPACHRALEMAGLEPEQIDLVIVATVTPDMAFPATATLLADELGMPDAAA